MCGAEHFQSEIICLIFCGCSATSGFDSQMVGGRFCPEDLRGLRTVEGLHLAIPCNALVYHACTLPYLSIPGITLYLAILCHTFPYLAYHACTLLYPAITLHRPSHCFAWEDYTSKMREHQLEKAIDDPSV